MLVKGFIALLSLFLTLAPACDSTGDKDRKSPSPQQSAPTQQAAISNESPSTSAANVSAESSGAGASPNSLPSKGRVDACKLLTSADIQAVQGEGLKETKGSEQTSGPLAISQCFYATANFTNSVSLTVTQKNADDASAGGPRQVWKERFGGESERERERKKEKGRDEGKERGEREGEEKEEGQPPLRVKGVGDEAYWVGNQKVGTLYVLKGDRFLRISIGGAEDQQAKIKKMTALARQAIKRL